ASATVNTGQQLGGSVGVALLNTLPASAGSSYIASHISPATLGHGRPTPAPLRQAPVPRHTPAVLWAAAVLARRRAIPAAPAPPPGYGGPGRRGFRGNVPAGGASGLGRWLLTQPGGGVALHG